MPEETLNIQSECIFVSVLVHQYQECSFTNKMGNGVLNNKTKNSIDGIHYSNRYSVASSSLCMSGRCYVKNKGRACKSLHRSNCCYAPILMGKGM